MFDDVPVYRSADIERIENKGLQNKVAWGHDLSVYLSDRLSLVGGGKLTLEEFCHDIDTNFSHGRDEKRDNFMSVMKELAAKVAKAVTEFGE